MVGAEAWFKGCPRYGFSTMGMKIFTVSAGQVTLS
jgi:hypothetical protein